MFGEFMGTLALVLLGNGVVANVLLRQSKGENSGWIVITTGWGLAVMAGVFTAIACGSSDAHINPAVTLGFWLMQKLTTRVAIGYVLAQLAGSVLGALPLLAWGALGRSVDFGATVPGSSYTTSAALLGEVVTTFALVVGLCVFLGFRHLRRFTPLLMPPLYGVMVPMEAALSGTSTNPARSFGPAVISGQWDGWWIYWVGPCLGTVAGILVCSALAKRIEEAKLYHFEAQRRRLFHHAAT